MKDFLLVQKIAGRPFARQSKRDWHDKVDVGRFLILLFVIAALANTINLLYSQAELSIYNFCALQVVVLNTTLILYNLLARNRASALDISHPTTLFGLFFFLYYLLPYIGIFSSDELTDEIKFRIILLFFISYISWCCGMTIGRGKGTVSSSIQLSKRNAQALFLICAFAVALIAYRYIKRTSEGVFFTQARYFESSQDVGSSIYEVFASSLELPQILLLGVLAAVPYKKIAKISYCFLIAYSSLLTFIYILSSQTRPAVTALIFALVSLYLCRKTPVKFRHLVVLSGVAFFAALMIQGVRVSSRSDFASADNQFVYALQNTWNNGIKGAAAQQDDITKSALSRANGGISTLQEIIEATDSGTPFLYGQGVSQMLPSLFPRFLWADKGFITSPSIAVRTLMNLPLYDSILSPVAEFYAEGGWTATCVGMFVYGWLLGKISQMALNSGKIVWWFALVFLWGQVAQMELELVVGAISVLRTAFVMYLIYRGLVFIIPEKSRSNV